MELCKAMENRRSIRKFAPDEISDEDIKRLIYAAVSAPSGCNSQCWKFVAVKSKDRIDRLCSATEKGVRRFYCDINDESFIKGRIKQTTFFKNAPLVIAVYLTEMSYHDKRVTEYYSKHGMDNTKMLSSLGSPDILSVGAAIENLLLKATEMGLGACWMNDPVVAEAEINEVLEITENCRLLSLIPIGKPQYIPRIKEMKTLDEILEII